MISTNKFKEESIRPDIVLAMGEYLAAFVELKLGADENSLRQVIAYMLIANESNKVVKYGKGYVEET